MRAQETKQSTEPVRAMRTVVRGTRDLSMPRELVNWAGLEGVRIVSRGTLRDVLVAAHVTQAALVIVDCEIVDNNAEKLAGALNEAQLNCAILCLGDVDLAAPFLAQGVDDYVGRRATYAEFLARAKRLLDSTDPSLVTSSGLRGRPARTTLRLGPLTLELIEHKAYVHDEPLNLRRAEFEVLVFLALNRHRLVSAKEIVREVLESHGDGGSARNQLFEIRRKLRGAGLERAIVTQHGQGYRLVL